MKAQSKTCAVVIWFLLTTLLAPAVLAAYFDEYINLVPLFIVYSAFSWWFATVMLIFGMTFLQGFLLGFAFWGLSFLLGDYYQSTLRLRMQQPREVNDAPTGVSQDPLKFMNLT